MSSEMLPVVPGAAPDGLKHSTPLESPPNPKHLLQIFEMMDAEHILMFASDYPHWDFDSPTHAFPTLPDDVWERIFRRNALELYGLEDKRRDLG